MSFPYVEAVTRYGIGRENSMGKNSKVEWCNHTWGPWRGGCSPRGPECLHCYAERDMIRYGHDPHTLTRSKTTFDAPLRWKDPAKIFVCSWSDFFLPEADQWRPETWDIMRDAPQHTYIIPTKRPELILDRLPHDWGGGWPNVWLLVSAGCQESVDKWVPELLKVPAAIRGLSAEPLLESIYVDPYLYTRCGHCGGHLEDQYIEGLRRCSRPYCGKAGFRKAWPALDWVIIGGESHNKPRKARPMPIAAAEDLKLQADNAGVRVFVKQMGTAWAYWTKTANGKTVYQLGDRKGSRMPYWPVNLWVREFPT